jgi:hypothetical protein
MVQRDGGKIRTFKDSRELEKSLLGVGIGVSGGAHNWEGSILREGD